jgi:hypothetical protein
MLKLLRYAFCRCSTKVKNGEPQPMDEERLPDTTQQDKFLLRKIGSKESVENVDDQLSDGTKNGTPDRTKIDNGKVISMQGEQVSLHHDHSNTIIGFSNTSEIKRRLSGIEKTGNLTGD